MTTNSAHSLASKFQPSDILAARKELARRSLADFAMMVDIPTVPITEDSPDVFQTMRVERLAAHHQLICDSLQGLTNGDIPNLMLLFPPGSAKSTYADVVFVPWYMSLQPRNNVILASYASDIAKKQGRRARQLIDGVSFHNLFGVGLKPDQRAADEWALTNGSEFMAGGLLSGLTGNRASLGIVDDPMKGRAEAESKTIRDKTWDAYIDDFCSRLIPGSPQVLIQTRWHQDDLAGRILPEDWKGESGVFEGRDGRTWHVLCCPAICESPTDPLGREIGETLWPEWFSLDHWEPFKRNRRTWVSLYQQRPAPDEGTFFQKSWFQRYKERPKNLRYYMTSDHAPGDSDASDWSVVRVWGIDADKHVWLVDGYRTQGMLNEVMGISIDKGGNEKLSQCGALPLIKKWRPLAWFPENDNNWKSASPFVTAAMRRMNVHCRIEPISPHGADKPTKARAIQAKASMGEVHIREGVEGDEIIEEYAAFPAGVNDDDVDNGSLIGRALDQAHPAILPTPKEKGKRDEWDSAFEDEEEASWKTM